MANDDDVMDEDSETDEFITASENEVEDEDSEEDEFAKQIREPKELVVYKIIKGVRCASLEVWVEAAAHGHVAGSCCLMMTQLTQMLCPRNNVMSQT